MQDAHAGPLTFVVRMWVEETAEEVDGGTWRGHITFLPDQDRRHVQDLTEITAFIGEHLRAIGLDP